MLLTTPGRGREPVQRKDVNCCTTSQRFLLQVVDGVQIATVCRQENLSLRRAGGVELEADLELRRTVKKDVRDLQRRQINVTECGERNREQRSW